MDRMEDMADPIVVPVLPESAINETESSKQRMQPEKKQIVAQKSATMQEPMS